MLDAAPPALTPLPFEQLELDPCPPRCSAVEYARLSPSELYKPIEPEEVIFDGEAALIWGDAAGSAWVIWGRRAGLEMTVWDDSMWVEEQLVGILLPIPGAQSPYGVSPENRLLDRRSAGTARSRVRVAGVAPAPPPALARIDDIPSDLLTPREKGAFAKLLERISKSRYAVGLITLLVVVLMARLAR